MVEYFACEKCGGKTADGYDDAWIFVGDHKYTGKVKHVCRKCAMTHWNNQIASWIK